MDNQTRESIFKLCKNHDTVFIVDVLNYLHRYMWVHKDMQAVVDNEPVCTGHLYGFTNLMIYLKRNYPNCGIVLALDGIDKERRSLNSEYKAQREHTYSVEKEMMELLKMCSLVDGVYMCHHDDYEADDVINVVSNCIYDLCTKHKVNKEVFILSNDKDMYQLIKEGEYCSVRTILKFGNRSEQPTIVGINEVKEKFNGVAPEDLVKFRAIVGDASDNLKGYFRFRKANAAIIAENYDYDRENKKLTLKEGSAPGLSWKKFLPTVLDNMETFSRNYEIMKLKDFDFEIIPISDNVIDSDVFDAVKYAFKYKLNKFLTDVRNYSRVRKMIDNLTIGVH